MDSSQAGRDPLLLGLSALLSGQGWRARQLWTIAAFLSIPALGVIDYRTGSALSFSIFYLAPIAVVVWLSGRAAGTLAAVASAIVWLVADLQWTPAATPFVLPYWNAIVRLCFFLVVVMLLAQVRSANQRLAALLQERTVAFQREAEDHRHTGTALGLFRQLVDRANDAIELIDPQTGRLLDANEKACEELGYSREELLTLCISDIDPHVDQAAFAELSAKLREGGHLLQESQHRRKDGSTFPVEVGITYVEADRSHVVAVARDISERKRAEEARRQSEVRYRDLIETASEGVWELDSEMRITFIDARMAEMLGYGEQELSGQSGAQLLFPEDLEDDARQVEARRRGERGYYERRLRRRDGSELWVMISASPILGAEGDFLGSLVMCTDLSERKRMEAVVRQLESELTEVEQRARALVEDSPLGVLAFDRELVVTECNSQLAEILGSRREELLGFDLHGLRDARFLPALEAALAGRRGSYEGPYHTTLSDRELQVALRAAPLLAADGSSAGGTGMIVDLTAGKQAEELLERLAYRDPLTQLPNRSLLRDRLRQAVSGAARTRQRMTVCVLNLDRFRNVNEALGQAAGDRLLQALAARLTATLRESDTVARTGGDEFTVLLSCGERDGCSLMTAGRQRRASARCAAGCTHASAERLRSCLAAPFEIDGHRVHVSASLGIVVFPDDGRKPETLLHHAESALRRAKELGGDGAQFYDPSMSRRAKERLDLESELRRAIEEEQLVVYYQPQVNLHDGAIVGVEALVRWQHPKRGLLPPGEFLPLAEETGLIHPLSRWVGARACREVIDWRNSHGSPLRLALNVAPQRLRDPGFMGSLREELRESGLPPERLEAEVTETALLADLEDAARVLAELRELGLGMALDDFGTGYSSLSHLHRLPINAVKIDRSFVGRCEIDPEAAAIVRAVTELGRSLGLRVVAEGVESEAQLALLQQFGCDEAQGYLFARPLPAEELCALLAAGGTLPAARGGAAG